MKYTYTAFVVDNYQNSESIKSAKEQEWAWYRYRRSEIKREKRPYQKKPSIYYTQSIRLT